MVVVGGRSSANTKELTRLCEIAGTHAIQIESVRDLTDAAAFEGARVVGVTGGTSTPIEDLHASRDGSSSWPGRRRRRPHAAAELAEAALAVAATPAGRTTSLPDIRLAGRAQLAAPPDPVAASARAGLPDRRHRRPAERRQEHALQPDRRRRARRSSRTARGRRATGSTATPTGTAAGSSSSTPAGSRSTRDDPIEARVQEQARLAIAEADVIVFVVDAIAGHDPGGPRGRRAPAAGHGAGHRRGQQGRQREARARGAPSSTRSAGRRPTRSRASHGRGTADLLDAIVWALPPETERSSPARRARPRPRRGPSEVAAGRLEPFVVGDDDDDETRRRRTTTALDDDAGVDADAAQLGRGDRGRGRRRAGGDRDRRPPERRQVEPAQRAARRGARDRLATSRGRPATPSTRRCRGAAARSSSSTPPAIRRRGKVASGPAAERYSTLRALRRSRGPTSRSSSSTPSRA